VKFASMQRVINLPFSKPVPFNVASLPSFVAAQRIALKPRGERRRAQAPRAAVSARWCTNVRLL